MTRTAHHPDAPAPLHLASLGRGFDATGPQSQQVFRAVLGAMSRPGRLHTLPSSALRGLGVLPGRSPALSALLLTLLDADTTLHLVPGGTAGADADDAALLAWLRFHTGVRPVAAPAQADFVLVRPAQAGDADLWAQLPLGSDEAPQQGATLVVDVPLLASRGLLPADATDGGQALSLRGPGIADAQALVAGGLGAGFWPQRIALQAAYPRGVDLLLCHGHGLAALPRSTHIRLTNTRQEAACTSR